jgi:hypothetical protein
VGTTLASIVRRFSSGGPPRATPRHARRLRLLRVPPPLPNVALRAPREGPSRRANPDSVNVGAALRVFPHAAESLPMARWREWDHASDAEESVIVVGIVMARNGLQRGSFLVHPLNSV